MSKKKHEEHENHERWIIPYADMVTLLFAFFVVMYSISQQDLAKLKNVKESLAEAFMGQKKGSAGSAKETVIKKDGPPESSSSLMMKRNVTNQELIDELRKQLIKEGFDFIYQDKVSPINVKIDSRGVVISVSSSQLFDENSTEVRPDWLPVLQVIADILGSNDRLIMVEGHTDNKPTVGTVFYSNWEMSVMRATAVVRVLTQEFGIDPTRITASGYANYRPLGDNNTEDGRALNRRVEIIMLNSSKVEDMFEDQAVPR